MVQIVLLQESATIFEHTLKADCNAYLPVDNVGLVTGMPSEVTVIFEFLLKQLVSNNSTFLRQIE